MVPPPAVDVGWRGEEGGLRWHHGARSKPHALPHHRPMADGAAQQVVACVLRTFSKIDPNGAPEAQVEGGRPPGHKAVLAKDAELKACPR